MAKKSKKPAPGQDGRKIVATNRRARHDYDVLESLEVGIVLRGSEVKSLRDGKASIAEAYGRIDDDNEVWLIGMHLPEYFEATRNNHEPLRRRKLLLNRSEIKRLYRKVRTTGLTLIPLDIYFGERGIAKITLALVQGKKAHDRRQDLKKRDAERDMRSYKR